MRKNESDFENEIAPRGSALYYSLLDSAADPRHVIISLHAFHQEIMKIAERYQEPSVAQAKLGWWQEEVKRLGQAEATHPITQSLQHYCSRFGLPEAALSAIIAAARLSIDIQIYPGQTELSHHYQHSGGLLELLKARVFAGGSADLDTEQYAQTLGIALDTIRHLSDFARHLQRGHLYLPADQLAAQQIAIDKILQRQDLDKLITAFAQQANYAREQYQAALKRLPATQYAKQRPGRIYAKLQFKLLDAIEIDGFQVLKHQLELSPLKKLWWSWREP